MNSLLTIFSSPSTRCHTAACALLGIAAGVASAATPVIVDPVRGTGQGCSLAEVSGRPAISYYDAQSRDLKFVRGHDTAGTSWSAPRIIDSTGDVGSSSSLAVVDGRPAIAYYDSTNGDLKYVQSADTLGEVWYAPVVVDAVGNTGMQPSLAVVEGLPAIAYYNASNGDLKYVRAEDPNGLFWRPPVTADPEGDVGSLPSLAIIGDRPAIAYAELNTWRAKYVRALDTVGDAWGQPLFVTSPQLDGTVGTLVEAAGHPAVCFSNHSGENSVMFIRALDPGGSSWGEPVAFPLWSPMLSTSAMVLVDGLPAIAYDEGRLAFVRALDAEGEAWRIPVPVDGITRGREVSLAVIGGLPAIAYQDMDSFQLSYVRSENVDFEGFHGVPNPLAFGSVMVGRTESTSVRLSNGLQDSVTVTSVEVANDDGSFVIVAAPTPVQLAPAQSLDIEVEFRPSAEGTATALFRANTDHGDVDTLEIEMTGRGIVHPVLASCQLEQGSAATGYSDNLFYNLTIDARGSNIAFIHYDDLIPGENSDLGAEVFLWSQDSGLRQITRSPDPMGGWSPVLSGDGRFLFFASTMDLVPGANPDGSGEIFLFTIDSGSVEQITDIEGATAMPAGVSDDGSIVFAVSSTGLDGGEPPAAPALFRLDRQAGIWDRIVPALGSSSRYIATAGNGNAAALVVSADPVPGMNPELNPEVFLWRLGSGIEQITSTPTDRPYGVDIDFHGRRVVFNASADLQPGLNPEGDYQVFLWTADEGFLQISRSSMYDGPSCVSIADAGDRLVFAAPGSQGLGSNHDLGFEVYLWEESGPGLVQWTDQSSSSDTFDCALSGSGRHLAFDSTDDLTATNPDRKLQLFIDSCALFYDGFETGDDRRWIQH